jgi:hypothetical protein
MENLFVIPQSFQSVIARVEQDKIIEIGTIDIPFASRTVYSENGLFVSIDYKEKALKIYRSTGELIAFNNQFDFKTLAVKENIVYLGGCYKKKKNGAGELCSLLDLQNLDFKYKQINLPIQLIKDKSIDDILVIGDRLILLDNIVYPKYVFEYNISVPDHPKHTNTIDLPMNGSYEHIIKGDGNEDWLVIYFSTMGMEGGSQYINISGKKRIRLSVSNSFFLENSSTNEQLYFLDEELLQEEAETEDFETLLKYKQFESNESTDYKKVRNQLNEKSKSKSSSVKSKVDFTFKDFCIEKDSLYLLRSDGLGVIDLNQSKLMDNFIKIETQLKDIKKLFKTPDNRIIVISKEGYELIPELK